MVSGARGQVFQDLKGNRFIQAWTAFGQAGWKLEGECEPDISFGLGKIDILGEVWLVVTFDDGEQFTWNNICWSAEFRQQPCAGGCTGSKVRMMDACACGEICMLDVQQDLMAYSQQASNPS